ncbi:MAG: 3-hexulose-6-phosphate synthase [Erysipelotrichaceae bacterium]
MKLHLAIDTGTLQDALHLIEQLKDKVDIVEIGTPLILEYGMDFVREVRKQFPNIKIFADMKIVDGASIESEAGFEAGADIISVLALANDQTIIDAVKQAKIYKKEILVDFIEVPSIKSRAQQISELNVDILCVHSGIDTQKNGASPLNDLCILRETIHNKEIAVAGGINIDNILSIAHLHPDIIVVGGALSKHKDPRYYADELRAIMNRVSL